MRGSEQYFSHRADKIDHSITMCVKHVIDAGHSVADYDYAFRKEVFMMLGS